ncbi:MAG: NPCBM/NEW2 domain-containing protein [Phycisphaerae bacterium]
MSPAARITALAGMVLVTAAVTFAEGRVETLDARLIKGEVTGIDAEAAIVKTGDKTVRIARKELSEVSLQPARDLMDRVNRTVVMTRDGGLIVTRKLALSEGKLSLQSELLGKVTLDMSAVSRIYLPDHRRSASDIYRRYQELRVGRPRLDRLVVARSTDRWLKVDGVIKSINDKTVTFRFGEEDRKTSLDNIKLIFIAEVERKEPDVRGVLVGKDGAKVAFTDVRMDGGQVTLTGANVSQRKIPRSAVAALEFVSDDVIDLTSLEPAEVKEYGFFETKFPHRVNLTVSGKPLTLKGNVYRNGLGLHSFCELTYDVGGKYQMFVALAGIDDAVRPNGDALLVILSDGKEIATHRLQGSADPVTVRANIKGAKKLTIRVDFGEDGLGVSDHVDIVSPRLIK